MMSSEEIKESLKADDFSMDGEIQVIFIDEAVEVLQSMDMLLPDWSKSPEDTEILKEIRRGFHTLKGSGRMVGASTVGEIAYSVEMLLNQVLVGKIDISDTLMEFIHEVKYEIAFFIQDFANQQQPSSDPVQWILKANNLRFKKDKNITNNTPKTNPTTSSKNILEANIDTKVHHTPTQPTDVVTDVLSAGNVINNSHINNHHIDNSHINNHHIDNNDRITEPTATQPTITDNQQTTERDLVTSSLANSDSITNPDLITNSHSITNSDSIQNNPTEAVTENITINDDNNTVLQDTISKVENKKVTAKTEKKVKFKKIQDVKKQTTYSMLVTILCTVIIIISICLLLILF